ncbi:Glycosyltransferase involved in cell wall bisynthesis [Paenisporosarcina quisquiliarum]|nr:Glycosyltransferase involved in cell wall bisynthesis [Paenisporosarcina quisquiliarum]
MSKATIAIPFFNNQKTLEYAILSVINQTYNDWELILINDGSTDNSLKIAKKYESEKCRIIDDGENRGLIARLNQAIELTESEYFVRMDSDDIMTPNRLEIQLKILQKNPEIDLVGSSAYIINENNEIIGIRKSLHISQSIDEILKRGLFIHPTVIGKTEWFRGNLYNYDFNRAEDLELWCRTYKKSNFINLKEPLLFYRDPQKFNIHKFKASSETIKKIIDIYASGNKIKNKLIYREKIKIIVYVLLDKLHISGITNKVRNSQINTQEIQIGKDLLNESILR